MFVPPHVKGFSKQSFLMQGFEFFRFKILSYRDRVQAVVTKLAIKPNCAFIAGGCLYIHRFRILFDR